MKYGCFWGWRSILWGMELLRKGLAWRVGDGETISIFGHQWIHEMNNSYLQGGVPSEICNFKVRELIDWNVKEWRRPLLSVLFPPEVVNNILAIHIPKAARKDKLYWVGAKDGRFLAKSAHF